LVLPLPLQLPPVLLLTLLSLLLLLLPQLVYHDAFITTVGAASVTAAYYFHHHSHCRSITTLQTELTLPLSSFSPPSILTLIDYVISSATGTAEAVPTVANV
jgi:hypothetical protein